MQNQYKHICSSRVQVSANNVLLLAACHVSVKKLWRILSTPTSFSFPDF
jgi:hypothetical protein